MALTSPGVEVSVINESFYVPSDAGTTPLFIVASSQIKRMVRVAAQRLEQQLLTPTQHT